MSTAKIETHKELVATARRVIRDCTSNRDAINAGLRIAACRAYPASAATAAGCRVAADNIADKLSPMYANAGTLSYRLARLVARRDWASLWLAARREVYPQSCK
ncbi:MAG: hypothetical protein WC530_09485 [Candidatus Omnitrophota bacterium]|jgi:hypothetical protein